MDTIDISEWLDFEFYNLVWYWDERKADMADNPKKIGQWLRIAHCVGSDMDEANFVNDADNVITSMMIVTA